MAKDKKDKGSRKKKSDGKSEATKHVVHLAFDRSTKNTHRYNEVDGNGVPVEEGFLIGTLYCRKEVLGETAPETLTVTVKVAKKE